MIRLLLACISVFSLVGCTSCSKEKQPVTATETADTVSAQRVVEKFDLIVTSRAYLDGVQSKGNRTRALVGLKYVNGHAVKASDFDGMVYEQAQKIIAQDWGTLMSQSLQQVKLTDEQLAIATLLAMRNGKYGFAKSDFLKALKENDFAKAGREMALHYANGHKRALGSEGKQYLWVLKTLWDGTLHDNSVLNLNDLLSLPSFSYKNLPVSKLYDAKGNILYNDDFHALLQKGYYPSPKEALNLK